MLCHRLTVLLLTLLLTGATGWLFTRMPTGLFPAHDVGAIRAQTEGAQGVSFEEMKRNQAQLVAIVLEDPDDEAFMVLGGGGRGAGRLQQRLHVHQA